jgi:hypothetical protein
MYGPNNLQLNFGTFKSKMTIREDFAALFGVNPDLVASAPGRVNLIGEHVDYSDGFVLPFAIQARTYAALRLRADDRIRVASKQHQSAIFESSVGELIPLTGPTSLSIVKFPLEPGYLPQQRLNVASLQQLIANCN